MKIPINGDDILQIKIHRVIETEKCSVTLHTFDMYVF